MSPDLFCLLLAILCLLVLCSAHEESSTVVELGDRLVLNCSQYHSDEGITVIHWVIPAHLQIYRSGYWDQTYQISQDGETFTIPSISHTQLGSYLCHFYNNHSHTLAYSKHNVLIHVPTLVEEYRMNFLIGGSAAAIFFTLITSLCLLYSYLWRGTATDVTPQEDLPVRIVAISDGHLAGPYRQEEAVYTKLQMKPKSGEGTGSVQGAGVGVTAM